MNRRILAAIAATSWLAGCVSILGVDPEDHDDLATVICECSEAGRETCSATLGAALEAAPDIEEVVLDCAASDPACGALDACLDEAGICSRRNGACTPQEKEDRVNLRCCDGFRCDRGKCVEGPSCSTIDAACEDGGCCEGLTCEDARCCVADNVACQRNEQCCNTSTCLFGTCQRCGETGDQCEGDSLGNNTCCDGLLCVGGFCTVG